ncbi:MAG: ubiquinone/menaquinone biosynthesis methyltransferase [Candidatus Tectomicrobia bacterium]|uniref:Demethylmenaquinone methyltransferase n=1 Tax=Tectimicrobiota bacterium TaxID=2528274 RepID=A0A937W2F6_UNCTE|nr:ubiquinone/menaquinone biosynthesis methyltransferase [Candidatus Tectomicrobia bacterium]
MLPGVTPQWLCGMFSRIAGRYDCTNTVISAGLDALWRRRLAQCVARQAALAVLDVACGTGGVLAQLMRHCPSATRLAGVDFTESMLRVGQRRLSARGTAAVQWCVGDALRLPYADASFDAVTMMFGVRNFADPARGLAECYRVLRAPGTLCLVEFSWPRRRAMQLVYGAYLRYVLPLVAWPLCGDWAAYRYLRDSVLAFRPQADLTTLLQDLGFTDIVTVALSGGITTLYEARKTLTVAASTPKETSGWQPIGV